MDGFLIKVFLERKVSDQVNAAGGEKQKGKQLESYRKNMSSKLDRRTFKEALLGNSHQKDKGDDPKKLPILGHRAAFSDYRQNGEDDSNINNVGAPIPVSVSKAELSWLKRCFVVQIRGMYDTKFVQQALVSDGFRVKVCLWSGFYAIICFEEEKQMAIFWDMKEMLLNSWFTDIDNLDNFMNKKKLRVWVCVQGMPLMAWQETMFTTLGSRWGRVVRLDADTVNKSRLYVARILLGTYSTGSYNDTPRASIAGKASGVGAKTVGTEDELKWDQSGGRTFQELSPRVCRLQDVITHPAVVADSGPNFTDLNRATGQAKTSARNGLLDVPIITEAASQDYSVHSVSIKPIFDTVTGLFSVRPKTIKHNKIYSSLPFRSIREKTQGRKVSASNKPKLVMKKTWKNNEERPVSVESGKKAPVEEEDAISEARAAMEFNFDGAVARGFGKAGIGGILRNSDNRSLIMFSKAVGTLDATSAELIMFKEACSLFGSSSWVKSKKLILETDCVLIAEWLNRSNSTSTVFRPLVEESLRICSNFSWDIRVVPRCANETADKLAKSGIGRLAPLVWRSKHNGDSVGFT
ncbi:hypothetical protein V6N11_082764 [Hibiscus sabdariffa]|uniref:RNase H type-1 domain-containing protein n=1 Tax=Hibiscus sabdariffa TaxID=183260 RepID=A0ABR2QJV8_9ROSI